MVLDVPKCVYIFLYLPQHLKVVCLVYIRLRHEHDQGIEDQPVVVERVLMEVLLFHWKKILDHEPKDEAGDQSLDVVEDLLKSSSHDTVDVWLAKVLNLIFPEVLAKVGDDVKD